MLFKKALGELLEKVKAISTKGLINKYSILNGAKYFYSGIFENYLLFITLKKYIKYFNGATPIDSWKSNGI